MVWRLEGSLLVNGHQAGASEDLVPLREVGMVFQHLSLYPQTVLENDTYHT